MQYQTTSPTSSCVGRDTELSRLHQRYAEAQTQGERLALLTGPSGIGKSRIIGEFRNRVRLEGGVVLEGRCEPGRAFGPFAEIVERALRFFEEVGSSPQIDLGDLACRHACHRFWYQHHGADAVAEPLGAHTSLSVAGVEAEAIEKRLRFFDAIHGLLREVASVRAPVVILHDLERADCGTIQLLQFLLEGTGPWNDGVNPDHLLNALFVVSVRSDADSPHRDAIAALREHPAADRIEVGHLDANGVRAYLGSPDTVARVIERTGGVPENIDLLLDGDPLTPAGRVERRLRSLSDAALSLMEAMAVVGRPADAELLARIADVSPSAAGHTEFGRSDLVGRSIVDGSILFAFARESDREHAYELMSEERRRELHARCVQVCLDQPGREQDAASHALAAGDFDRAVPLALDAAHALAARHAHGEAASVLEQVLGAMPNDPPIVLHEYLADLYRAAGDYKQALQHARTVRRANPEAPRAARRVGELLTFAGKLDEAAEELEDARRLATSTDDPGAVLEVQVQLAELHYQRACYDEAREAAERALDNAVELGALALELHARNTLGKVALAQKEARAAAEMFVLNQTKAADASLGREEAQALTNLGVAMLRRQDLGAAEQAFEQAIEVAAKASDARARAIATENLAVLAHWRHDYGRAQPHYHEAVALLKRLGNRPMLARVAINLGELYLDLNQPRRARSLCEFSAYVGGTGLPPSVTAESLILRGRTEMADAEHSAARTAFEGALRIYERLGEEARIILARLELARVALAEGEVADARRILAEVPVPESPKREAEVALVTAEVERAAGGDTLGAARRALEIAERAEDDELLLPALLGAARALIDDDRLEEASRLLERAHQVEADLTERVPQEAYGDWVDRPMRQQMSRLVSRLSAAWKRERDSVPPRRPSSIPPPQKAAAPSDQQAQWARRYPNMVGTSPSIQQVMSLLDKVAPTDALVLIRGESGTGKELIAEALHDNSPRRSKPLVKVNCAALVETLLLSELFGHERGAFTGANARKKGRFELADGGTIFLDEIGDISPKTQVALLRVLQEREFERVGGTQPIKVDVRIVTATHRDLEAMVREGTFREDLYYRLRGVMMEMPPLRSHLADLGPLCEHLLDRIATERGESPKVLSPEALRLLESHRWPGNVRELENVLRSATLFADSPMLTVEDFAAFAETFTREPEPETAVEGGDGPTEAAALEDLVYGRVRGGDHSLLEMKKVIERECIARALDETDGNITQAASLLGMKRPRLSQLVKQYGLNQSGEA